MKNFLTLLARIHTPTGAHLQHAPIYNITSGQPGYKMLRCITSGVVTVGERCMPHTQWLQWWGTLFPSEVVTFPKYISVPPKLPAHTRSVPST